jgi:hypothetical protein
MTLAAVSLLRPKFTTLPDDRNMNRPKVPCGWDEVAAQVDAPEKWFDPLPRVVAVLIACDFAAMVPQRTVGARAIQLTRGWLVGRTSVDKVMTAADVAEEAAEAADDAALDADDEVEDALMAGDEAKAVIKRGVFHACEGAGSACEAASWAARTVEGGNNWWAVALVAGNIVAHARSAAFEASYHESASAGRSLHEANATAEALEADAQRRAGRKLQDRLDAFLEKLETLSVDLTSVSESPEAVQEVLNRLDRSGWSEIEVVLDERAIFGDGEGQ